MKFNTHTSTWIYDNINTAQSRIWLDAKMTSTFCWLLCFREEFRYWLCYLFVIRTSQMICSVLFIFLSIELVSSQKDDVKQPNIIYILSDDLGHGDVGFTGGNIKTPNLDKLAEEGRETEGYQESLIINTNFILKKHRKMEKRKKITRNSHYNTKYEWSDFERFKDLHLICFMLVPGFIAIFGVLYRVVS